MDLKLGDWIKIIDELNNIFCLRVEELITPFIFKFEDELYNLKEIKTISIEKWTVQPGEICWFWSENDTIPTLGSFTNIHREDFHNTYTAIIKGNFCELFDYCEPYCPHIKPTLLKD